jgi:hypothetical protein
MIHNHTLQILGIEKGANPGSVEALAKFSSMQPLAYRADVMSFPLGFPPSRITLEFTSELNIHFRVMKSYTY